MPLFLLPFLAGAKSFFGAILTFCSRPPGSYIAIAAGVAVGLWWYGQHEFNKGKAACEAQRVAAAVRLVEHQANINMNLGALYVPQFVFIQTETVRRISEIPKHVTTEIDRKYPVPLGFVRVWNDGTHGPIPGPATGRDEDPSGVPLSDVATAHTEDQGTLDTCRKQIDLWWDWYDQQAHAFNKP